jgi:TolB-like protein/Flp pilus assembly protein TadD
MKRCPTCGRVETDETLKFCRVDGAVLLAAVDQTAPTIGLPEKPRPEDQVSIGILPFVNMTADPENEFFCDGLAEELINALTKIEKLHVLARTTSFSFKGKNVDVNEIGRRLGLSHAVEGSVRKSGSRVRITVRLINVENGYDIWSERFDRELSDVFAIQDEIALAVVNKLKLNLLRDEEAALLAHYRNNIDAYNCYLKGRYYWAQRPLGISTAIEYFEQAIEIDSNYALAYAGLADCYNALGSWENGTMAPSEAMPKAKAAGAKALDLDRTLAEAQCSFAYTAMHFDWDWSEANQRIQRAFSLNPNYPSAHHWHSHYLMATGRSTESLDASRRFVQLDPLDIVANSHLAWHYLFAREYNAALEQCEATRELFPNAFWPPYFGGFAYEQKGMFDEAAAEFKKAITLSGNLTCATAGLGHVYALAGEKDKALEIIAALDRRSQTQYTPVYDIAIIYAGLGELDEAFARFERDCDQHSSWLAYLAVEPRLDPLRGNPRFGQLLARVGLTGPTF